MQLVEAIAATEILLYQQMCSGGNCPPRSETTARGVLCFFFDIPQWLPEEGLLALRGDCCDNSNNSINVISCYWDMAANSRDYYGGGWKKNCGCTILLPYKAYLPKMKKERKPLWWSSDWDIYLIYTSLKVMLTTLKLLWYIFYTLLIYSILSGPVFFKWQTQHQTFLL